MAASPRDELGGLSSSDGDDELLALALAQHEGARAEDDADAIPGPAGRFATPRATASAAEEPAADCDFARPPWAAALRLAGACASVADALSAPATAKLPRLAALVTAVQRSYCGESGVRLKDPSGAIGGTLAADVLAAHPALTAGAAVVLEDVTVLVLPQPTALRHLCIAAGNVARVVPADAAAPPAGGAGAGWGAPLPRLAPPPAPAAAPARPAELEAGPAPRAPPLAPANRAAPPPAKPPSPSPPPPPAAPAGGNVDDLMAGLDDDDDFL
jgi:hypothetical protein